MYIQKAIVNMGFYCANCDHVYPIQKIDISANICANISIDSDIKITLPSIDDLMHEKGSVKITATCHKCDNPMELINVDIFLFRKMLLNVMKPVYHNDAHAICFVPPQVRRGQEPAYPMISFSSPIDITEDHYRIADFDRANQPRFKIAIQYINLGKSFSDNTNALECITAVPLIDNIPKYIPKDASDQFIDSMELLMDYMSARIILTSIIGFVYRNHVVLDKQMQDNIMKIYRFCCGREESIMLFSNELKVGLK